MGEERQAHASETFADEGFLIFVRRKAERMVTALYIVTDLLSDKEPLKWSLRHTCITMLGELLPRVRRALTSRDAEIVAHKVSEITSLLEIAKSSRLLSEMNAALLYDACRELKTLLGELGEQADINSRMLNVPEPQRPQQNNGQGHAPEKDINDRMSVTDNMSFNIKKSYRKRSTAAELSPDREVRQQKIRAFLQEKGTSTMTDIKKIVSGVSDKTLQRDITNLVERGVINKSGSKRWTNYRLV